MRPILTALAFAFTAMAAHATDLPTADDPPPLRDADRYLTHVETAIFNGSLEEVATALRTAETGVLAYIEPTDRIPAITGLTPLSGQFPDEGATRRVSLEGGFYVVERVLISDADTFAYQIWNFTAPGTFALDHIRGEFQYTDLGDGRTEVTWTYAIAPRVFLVRPFVRRFLENDFAPFMAAGLSGAAAAFNDRAAN